MLWDKLCWLLALLALSSGGLLTPNDPLSTPRIFLSFKGKPHNSDVATHYTRRYVGSAPFPVFCDAMTWFQSRGYDGGVCE